MCVSSQFANRSMYYMRKLTVDCYTDSNELQTPTEVFRQQLHVILCRYHKLSEVNIHYNCADSH